MILSMTFQCRLFFIALVLGTAGGLVYTLIFSTGFIKKHRTAKNIFHIVFWLVFALVIFLTMLSINYGEIRPFSILGIALGLFIYHLTAEYYVQKAAVFFYKIFMKLLFLLIEIIFTPIKIALFPVKKIFFNAKKLFFNAKKLAKFPKV